MIELDIKDIELKVGIICAGDREFEPFLPHIQHCATSEKAMLTFHEGTINDVAVVALFCGVCKTNAALATQILIDTYGVNIVINAGTAGGMSNEANLFDTIICTEVAHHDVDKGILTEFHPWMTSIFFKSDPTLLALAGKLEKQFAPAYNTHKLLYGRMVTGEQFITDDGRAEINAEFCPLSVDMETASIAHVCYVNSIPFIAIRTLTDTADHSGVAHFEINCAKASFIAKEFTLGLLNEIKAHY